MPISERRARWARLPLWRRRKLLERLKAANARKRAARKAPVEHVSLAFWRGMGVWITKIHDFPADWLKDYAKGYRYVVVPVLWGHNVDPGAGTPDELRAWVAKAREWGFKVVGSQWGVGDDPQAEANAAVEIAAKFDGWIINGEKPYEGGGKSAVYVSTFRKHLPGTPLGWSPEPRLDLDHGVLQRNGVAYMPQAYPLESGWNVDACVEWGVKFGYALDNIVPLVQAYPNSAGTRWPAGDYRKRAIDARIPGLILYAGNQAADVPNYWRELIL